MLDIKYLRENLETVKENLALQHSEPDFTLFTQLDNQRRDLLKRSEQLKSEKNRVSDIIGKTKNKKEVQGEIARMKEMSATIRDIDNQLSQIDGHLTHPSPMTDPPCGSFPSHRVLSHAAPPRISG